MRAGWHNGLRIEVRDGNQRRKAWASVWRTGVEILTVPSGLGTDQGGERSVLLERALGPVFGQVTLRSPPVGSGPPGLSANGAHFLALKFPFFCLFPAPGSQGYKLSSEHDNTLAEHVHKPAPLCLEGSKSLAPSIFMLESPICLSSPVQMSLPL